MNAFYQEIMDQPEALRQMLYHYAEARNPDFEIARDWMADGRRRPVIFTGMASSAYS